MKTLPLSVIILTYNEAANIRVCLESIKDLTREIFIVDSFSCDVTLEIAREYTKKIFQNTWTNYAGQRQWALANLPFTNDWILFLDADERLTESLKTEIGQVISQEVKNPAFGGFYISRKFFFLGKLLSRGGFQGGLKELRLCNRHHLTIKERAGHEVYVSGKKVGFLRESMIHEDKKPLSSWIERHNFYSTCNAKYLWSLKQGRASKVVDRKIYDRRLYWKEKFRGSIWNKLPFGFRPTFYFIYNYFFRLGFLDGIPGFVYIFLHDFWFNLLVDAKYLELKNLSQKNGIK